MFYIRVLCQMANIVANHPIASTPHRYRIYDVLNNSSLLREGFTRTGWPCFTTVCIYLHLGNVNFNQIVFI